jgi:lipopolysaccharide/colanic/teichoic acid biosynthesis glycosyltransferase
MEAERAASYWPAEEDDKAEEPWVAVALAAAGHRPAAAVTALHELAGGEGEAIGDAPPEPYLDRWKRVIDLALGIPLFLLALPVIVLAALAVIVTSGRPAFYRTTRVGAGQREFTMWKIRSMVKDADEVLAAWRETHPELAAEYEANFKLTCDPRVTAVGRFIRRTSIDELPQFWNVIRGDMSLVGPRPYYARELTLHPVTAEVITRVRPGVTGPWQVAGRNALGPAERMFLDRTYVSTCSLGVDLRLLVTTVATLARPNGV